MLNDEFLIILGSLASLVLLFFVLVLMRAFKRRQNNSRSLDLSEPSDYEAVSAQQSEAALSSSFSSFTSLQAPVSIAQLHPVSYERFPQLSAGIQQARVRRELVTTFATPLTALLNVFSARALDLYCQHAGVSKPEGVRAVIDLMANAAGEQTPVQLPFPNGADPLITLLLLHADCRDDAIRYFCLSTGASPAEAREAIETLRPIAESASWFFFEEGMFNKPALDPASLQFLIRAGYKTLAIRYYHRRTAVGLSEAKKAVEEIAHRFSC